MDSIMFSVIITAELHRKPCLISGNDSKQEYSENNTFFTTPDMYSSIFLSDVIVKWSSLIFCLFQSAAASSGVSRAFGVEARQLKHLTTKSPPATTTHSGSPLQKGQGEKTVSIILAFFNTLRIMQFPPAITCPAEVMILKDIVFKGWKGTSHRRQNTIRAYCCQKSSKVPAGKT